MTKEVDLLSLSKTSENTVAANSKNTSKKEGLSLFDSLLVNNKSVDKNSTTETKNENLKTEQKTLEKVESKTSTSETKITNESQNEKIENQENSKKVEQTNSKSKDEPTNKNFDKNLSDNTENSKTETKTNNTNSLLDRMILESKKDSKNKNNLTEKANTNSKEINKEEASLLDKSIKDAKYSISEEKTQIKEREVKTDKKIEVTEDKKTELKDEKVQVKELETKIDKKDDLKVAITEDKNTETKKEKIEVTEDKKTELKDEKVQVKESETKIDKKDDLKVDTLEDEKLETKDNDVKIDKKVDVPKDDVSFSKLDKNVELANQGTVKEIIPENNEEKSGLKLNSTVVNSKDETKNEKLFNNEEKNTKIVNNTIIDNKEPEIKIEKKDEKNTLNNTRKMETEPLLDDERIQIDRSLLKGSKEEDSKSVTKSLMDRLLDNAKDSTITSKQTINTNETLKNQETSLKSNDVVTNIFLGSQKNSIYNQMLSNKNEGIKTVKDGKDISDIKKSAQILDLNMKDASLDIEQVSAEANKINLEKDTVLDRLAFAKNIKKDEYTQQLHNSVIQSSSVNTEVAEEVINLNVSQSTALSIQSRIVGAQQQMSSMLSDIARNMYQNYKPPVTAFRINLFPAQLGHIAILMKSDKDNGMNISMNVSNASTLDAMMENQGSLRDALSRNFNTNQASFTLEFNMQGQNSGQDSQNNQDNKQEQERHSSEDILESLSDNKDVAQDLNYL